MHGVNHAGTRLAVEYLRDAPRGSHSKRYPQCVIQFVLYHGKNEKAMISAAKIKKKLRML